MHLCSDTMHICPNTNIHKHKFVYTMHSPTSQMRNILYLYGHSINQLIHTTIVYHMNRLLFQNLCSGALCYLRINSTQRLVVSYYTIALPSNIRRVANDDTCDMLNDAQALCIVIVSSRTFQLWAAAAADGHEGRVHVVTRLQVPVIRT